MSEKNKKRIKKFGIFLAILYVALIGKIYYVQQKYGTETTSSSIYRNVQSERISDINYQLLDMNGKELFNYNKHYVFVVDSKPFRLNNYKENVEEIMALELIMKNEVKEFSFDNIIKSEGKSYYNISEDGFNKIQSLKHIKGIYSYCYNTLDKTNSWSIENIIANIEEKEGGYEENTLAFYMNNLNKSNKKNTINFSLDSNIQYNQEGYTINKDNFIPYTTLNKDWNKKIEDILSEEEYKKFGNIGVAIVEKGKIRALQCKDEKEPNTILASTGMGYEPGSTFKALILEAALQEKNTYMGEKFTCEGAVCKKSHGEIDLETAVKVSCNDVFAILGNRLGYEKIMEYCNKYEINTSVLGLEPTIETVGTKPREEARLNNISIGQTFNIAPLQILGVYDSIVNTGDYYRPYILEKFEDYDGNTIKKMNPVKENILSEEVANTVKGALRETVKAGTGMAAQVNGVDIGGKTGSSTGNDESTHGWFVGYFNIGKTYYTMVVFAPNITGTNEKGEELLGGNTCAPIFKKVVESIVK